MVELTLNIKNYNIALLKSLYNNNNFQLKKLKLDYDTHRFFRRKLNSKFIFYNIIVFAFPYLIFDNVMCTNIQEVTVKFRNFFNIIW